MSSLEVTKPKHRKNSQTREDPDNQSVSQAKSVPKHFTPTSLFLCERESIFCVGIPQEMSPCPYGWDN